MKQFFTLLFILFLSVLFKPLLHAQSACPPCPALFLVGDSTNCNRVEVRKNPTMNNYSNNPVIRACQNSIMKYDISVDAVCFPSISYNVGTVTGGSLVSASGNTFTINWGSGSTGTVLLTFFSPGGAAGISCNDTINLNFNLITSPTAAFTASPQPVCKNTPTLISFNSSSTLNANSFLWNFGDGFTSTSANPSHSYTSPGSYTVTLIAGNTTFFNGQPLCPTCVDTAQQNIFIDPLPAPPIECVATVCAGATETYYTPAAPCATYLWTVTGGTIVGANNGPNVTVTWGSGVPQGTLNLIVSGCATTYCSLGNTVTIPIIPNTGAISGSTLVCLNSTEAYSLPAWPGTTYSWSISGGGAITPFNTNTSQVNILWNNVGDHTITCNYFDTALNCGGTATYLVRVRGKLRITGPSTICEGSNGNYNANALTPALTNINSVWTVNSPATIAFGNNTPFANINFPSVGTYNITASNLVPLTVCNTANYTVNVVPKPVISAIIGPDTICPGGVYIFKAISNLSGTFTWFSSGAVSILNLGSNNDSVQVTWGTTGPYTLSVFQTTNPYNCVSNTFSQTFPTFLTPAISGPINVCADAIVTYTVTNIAPTNTFNWFITPAQFGTIQNGQGTPTVTIKWHGNNNPGVPNTVWLHYGVCDRDSIAITINEPIPVTITPSGSICGGGVTLTASGSGTYTWSGPLGFTPPMVSTNVISGLSIPGVYNVSLLNGGCVTTGSYTIPNTGLPNNNIWATGNLYYCFPAVPNMSLSANPGYSYKWYQVGSPAIIGTSQTLPINTLTMTGTYSYYCVISIGSCTVTSNTITIYITNCVPGGPGGCSAQFNVTINGCNPFTLTPNVYAPAGATLIGNPTIEHLEDGYIVNSYTTRNYTTVGVKQVRLSIDINLPAGGGVCRVPYDTVVVVNAAANFTKVINCKSVSLYDASTTISPATVSGYTWSVGSFPGNLPVGPGVANFTNAATPNTVLDIFQSGTYIITETIKVGVCILTHMDTVAITIPDADFTPNNSCVSTPVSFSSISFAPTHFWNFGDASTSYVNPTSHAYATSGNFNVTHIVTLANGCKDTVVKPITIFAAPNCVLTYATPLTFCFGDSVILNACPGLTGYQWYKNGVAIAGANTIKDTVKQTGNYYCTAINMNGCIVRSDTVSIIVNPKPNVNILTIGNGCVGTAIQFSVPACPSCSYMWEVDGLAAAPTGNIFNATSGVGAFTVGPHNVKVKVTNAFGCNDTSSVNIVINPLPTVSISVVGPAPICSNNVYILNASTSAASPSWAWTYNNFAFVLSNTNSLTASAAGTYKVKVTDGITGCINQTTQNILPSPELNLFPVGCDTLCDTSHVFLPLQSFNGNLTGYTIDWYDNGAPLYATIIYTGVSLPLNILPIGNHVLSVIVTSPNGCMDTSNVYNILTKACNATLSNPSATLMAKQIGNFGLINWFTNSELNFNYFVIERSTNGSVFNSIGQVNSYGNSITRQNYSFNDPQALGDNPVFYRLKIVSTNGTITYTNIVKIIPEKLTEETLQALPNITKNITKLYVTSKSASSAKLTILGTDGKVVKQQIVNLTSGLNNFDINLNALAQGYYIIKLNTTNSNLTTTVIKN